MCYLRSVVLDEVDGQVDSGGGCWAARQPYGEEGVDEGQCQLRLATLGEGRLRRTERRWWKAPFADWRRGTRASQCSGRRRPWRGDLHGRRRGGDSRRAQAEGERGLQTVVSEIEPSRAAGVGERGGGRRGGEQGAGVGRREGSKAEAAGARRPNQPASEKTEEGRAPRVWSGERQGLN